MAYAETYRRSLERPEEFWAEAAEGIDWERRWDKVRSPGARAVRALRGLSAGGDWIRTSSTRARSIWLSPLFSAAESSGGVGAPSQFSDSTTPCIKATWTRPPRPQSVPATHSANFGLVREENGNAVSGDRARRSRPGARQPLVPSEGAEAPSCDAPPCGRRSREEPQ
jgi:Acetyl-coenzyme A synthetase N-terminus